MGKHATLRRTAAVRIAIALAALAPTPVALAGDAPARLTSAPAARATPLALPDPSHEAAEWERLRRRLS